MTPEKTVRPFLIFKGAALIAALFAWVGTAVAEQVTVRSEGGGFEVQGSVVGFDGQHLRLRTEYGVLTMSLDTVTCNGDGCPQVGIDPPVLRMSGDARMAEIILPALVEGYARQMGFTLYRLTNPPSTLIYILSDQTGVPILELWFEASSTVAGMEDIVDQSTDVLLAARRLTTEEQARARDVGLGALGSPRRATLLAFEAQVPIVSPRLPLQDVSLLDLARAMAGDVTNWSTLGGPDLPISLHLTDLENGLTQAFVDQFVGQSGSDLSEDVTFHATPQALAEAVAGDAGALGVTSVLDVGNAQSLGLRDECDLVAVPTNDGIKTGDYPLSYPLYLYMPRRYIPVSANDFFDWLTFPEAQIIMRRAGVVSQAPVPIAIAQQGQRLAHAIDVAGDDVSLGDLQAMVGQLGGRARLSMTFRFDGGQQQLDLTSWLQARALADAIAGGQYSNQSLLLAGFSDGEGSGGVNRQLSLSRAAAVRDEIVEMLGGRLPEGVRLTTAGFGEALPIGCDDTVWGRQANRRVELWSGRSE